MGDRVLHHSRLRGWLQPFRGVASPYLGNYHGWRWALDGKRSATPDALLRAALGVFHTDCEQRFSKCAKPETMVPDCTRGLLPSRIAAETVRGSMPRGVHADHTGHIVFANQWHSHNPSTLSRTNMSIVIINWQGGENDPFTYFSACMKQAFERMGRPTHIVNLDNSMMHELAEINNKGIDFVILWQGVGMQLGVTDTSPATLWDQLKVPVICYHGDHPCHMAVHHKATSPWVQHIYGMASFARFANTHFSRESSATFFPAPVMFTDGVKGRFEGDFFVFPKNLDDLDSTLDGWRGAPQRRLASFLLDAADAIISEFRNGNRTNHHDIIDGMLNAEVMAALCEDLASSEFAVRLHIHMLLDKIHRNAIAEHVVNDLKDVPLKIYGRGWERFRLRQNRHHEFLSFDAMSDNAFQFASRYGIIDVAPVQDSLHDRTLRAMGNRSGFLMGSSWPFETFLGGDYSDLFFDGAAGGLRARAERVMQSPEAHRAQCCEFARHYQQHFSPFNFIKYLEGMSDSIKARARA